MTGGNADPEPQRVTIEEVRGPHGPVGDDGALLTLVLSNGLEAEVRIESVRTEPMWDSVDAE